MKKLTNKKNINLYSKEVSDNHINILDSKLNV